MTNLQQALSEELDHLTKFLPTPECQEMTKRKVTLIEQQISLMQALAAVIDKRTTA